MNFDITAKLEAIFDTQQISEKFKKREFVLEVQSGMYPEYIKMQLTQERCQLIDVFEVGEIVRVCFNLRGRPYEKAGEKTYFTNLEAWRIEAASAPTAPPPPSAPAPTAKPKAMPPPVRADVQQQPPADDLDDLPF